MKKLLSGLVASLLLTLAVAGTSLADVVSLEPSQAVVLSSDGSGNLRIAVQFDLSSLRSGAHRKVEYAHLEWVMPGMPSETPSKYDVRAVTGSWTEQSPLSGGTLTATKAGEPVDEMRFYPKDYEALGQGQLRLDVTQLANDWASGAAGNYGLLLSTPDIQAGTVSGHLGEMRLVVGYGFAGE